MKDNIRIAKELVRIASGLINEKPSKWTIWWLDMWGNAEDGFEFNDRSKYKTFVCNSDDRDEIEKECLNQFSSYDLNKIEIEWTDENEFYIRQKSDGMDLYQVEKDRR